MYLLNLHFANAKHNKTGQYVIDRRWDNVAKWTFLPAGAPSRELLQLIAVALAGPNVLNQFRYPLRRLRGQAKNTLRLEFRIARHFPFDIGRGAHPFCDSGIRLSKGHLVDCLTRDQCRLLSDIDHFYKLRNINSLSKLFLVASGPEPIAHDGNDDFDFNAPDRRLRRFQSLFTSHSLLTDPVAFLALLQYRGVHCGKWIASSVLRAIADTLPRFMNIDTVAWFDRAFDFRNAWTGLYKWQQKILIPVLDICRHMVDAFPASQSVLANPGVVLLNRPDRLCGPQRLGCFLNVLDRLLPRMQFVATLGAHALQSLPQNLSPKRLVLPKPWVSAGNKPPPVRLRPDAVLLIDVDSRLPNVALMKLSRYYKDTGREVILVRGEARIPKAGLIFASLVFNSPASLRRIQSLRRYYGDDLIIGGSGIDIHTRLAPEIERLPADYDLYPVLGDRAIGFLTRGCPANCPFCIVPQKEGKPHSADDLSTLLSEGRRKLILLDDNILAHRRAETLLDEMIARGIQVNFTQTLDFRHLTRKRASLLRRIRCANTRFSRSNYYFSVNDNRHLELLKHKYEMFAFSPKENVEFVCMYGFNTTLSADVERFAFLRTLPGAYVFMQQYQPVPGGPPPNFEDFFDDNADTLIDQLIKIIFTQNMKSMEKYYRWVSDRYAREFGKLHMGLVNTLFRYNNRHLKGKYIATLAGTRK